MTNPHESSGTPPLKSFGELIHDGKVISGLGAHLLARDTGPILEPPRTESEKRRLGSANHLAGYYLRAEPSVEERQIVLRSITVGEKIGRLLLEAQYDSPMPEALQTGPNLTRLIPDAIPAVHDSLRDLERMFLVQTAIHGLGIHEPKQKGLSILATGLAIYGYEQHSKDFARTKSLIRNSIEMAEFDEIVDNQLSDLKDL